MKRYFESLKYLIFLFIYYTEFSCFIRISFVKKFQIRSFCIRYNPTRLRKVILRILSTNIKKYIIIINKNILRIDHYFSNNPE